MIIATTFTVCLAYRHYQNTRLIQFLVIAYMYVLRFFLFLIFFFFFFFCCCFVLLIFLLQNAPIAMIFDDAIYLFFAFYFNVIASKSNIKTIQKMGERDEKKKHTLQQRTYNYHTSNVIMSGGTTTSVGGAVAWWLTPRTPDPEVGVRAPFGSPCCVLEQDIFTPPPPQKKKKIVLVISRKRWLRPNMTEKLFTGR